MTNSEYPKTSSTGKHYRIIQGDDGRELWEYESGIIRDPVAKHNLAFGPDHGIKSSEQAKEMQALGQEAIRRDILNGYKKAIQAKTGKTVETDAAVREVFGQAVMEHALASPYTPGSVHAKRLAAELADMLPDKRRAEVSDGQGNSVSGDPAFVERVLGIISKARAAE